MNYYSVVFLLRPPYLLRREPLFDGRNVCNSQENGVGTRRAAIVNHYAIVNLLRRANLLRRSIFSTAGSFGQSVLVNFFPSFFWKLVNFHQISVDFSQLLSSFCQAYSVLVSFNQITQDKNAERFYRQ